jgi:hypothetical protein
MRNSSLRGYALRSYLVREGFAESFNECRMVGNYLNKIRNKDMDKGDRMEAAFAATNLTNFLFLSVTW